MKLNSFLGVLFALFVYCASAQVSFNTGNDQLDSDLNTINTNGSSDFNSFKSELSTAYGVSESKINNMKVTVKMTPGEIYLALEISKLSNKPIDDVITIYEKNKSKGWGYIAKKVGIKPGSSEFTQLKSNASSKKGGSSQSTTISKDNNTKSNTSTKNDDKKSKSDNSSSEKSNSKSKSKEKSNGKNKKNS